MPSNNWLGIELQIADLGGGQSAKLKISRRKTRSNLLRKHGCSQPVTLVKAPTAARSRPNTKNEADSTCGLRIEL